MRPFQPYFLEDLEVGQEFETPRRTITETDLVTFAMFSSDWNAIHTDVTSVQNGQFGKRIVHGALGLTIATGLVQRTGMFEGSAVALLGIAEWVFAKPLYVGDTVFTRLRITEVRPTSDGRRGVIGRELKLVNQHDDVIQHGRSDFMVLRREPAAYSAGGTD
ncbi:MAG TPA: MaoC/PaaZ C-terminal domain-containing protein [Amycolatopsis sp.]|jgi:acyl dehydratase|nr:MaoC/PaaZ C-terminal domain-containing protein [Amycolatopsis sp.]